MAGASALRRAVPARRRRRGDTWTAALCLAPALAVIGAFVIYPIVATGRLSLTSWNGATPELPFVGLANYAEMAADPEFRNSLVVTILYGLGVTVLGVVSGLGLAVLLNAPIRGLALYRGIFFLPVVTSSIAVATVWKYLFEPDGPFSAGLNWLGDPSLALVSLTLLTAWKQLGLNVVLYLTALQAIPAHLYEAAALDGATRWRRLRHITIPLLAPMTFFVILEGLIATFQGFDLVYALTQGGPLGGTEVLGFLVYRTAFASGEFGYAATIAYAGFALVLGLSWMNWRLQGGGARWS
ncbi:multiple sugar transport system permease protein [Thermocatellispora tengchongensis]|uniref:Multiple sugar transport system permease protein n=2 Tax=Thermocatellispora tengchongensis TaxID=1073253 RepID=A0A840NTL0_9ACTN|nr:sugar ABC transporter permease [Thermocatellispora tengchongensis]MBB5130592.1 multiple sugar transport system permease protein [Thermocatellispora tengchongensis]